MTTQAKMNPEIKQRWVEALRSGDYKQGFEVLHDRNDCFCVLGVLADIAVKDGVTSWRAAGNSYACGDQGLTCFLPLGVIDWAGLDQVPIINSDSEYGAQIVLMNRNDTHKQSFAQLAAYIEENL